MYAVRCIIQTVAFAQNLSVDINRIQETPLRVAELHLSKVSEEYERICFLVYGGNPDTELELQEEQKATTNAMHATQADTLLFKLQGKPFWIRKFVGDLCSDAFKK
ncbi:hypothetical protein Tco_0327998 [Tanacetum coccineum]